MGRIEVKKIAVFMENEITGLIILNYPDHHYRLLTPSTVCANLNAGEVLAGINSFRLLIL